MAKHPHNLENFNAINLKRVRIAESIAGIYAQHPDVWAILLGGSTARGTAGRHSDLDLGIFGQPFQRALKDRRSFGAWEGN